jgi:hypothetical protein
VTEGVDRPGIVDVRLAQERGPAKR